MSLLVLPERLDFSHVWDEVPIGSLVDPHCTLAHPVLVPVSDDIEVSYDSTLTLTTRHVGLELRQVVLNEALNCFKDPAVVLGFDVSVRIA